MTHTARLSVEDVLIFEERFVDPSQGSGLMFCESALDVQAVGTNAVCLSITANWDDLKYCTEWISRFARVYALSQNKEFIENIRAHIMFRPVLVPSPKAFNGHKTIHEMIDALGQTSFDGMLMSKMDTLLPTCLIKIGDVSDESELEMAKTISHIPLLNMAIGGFYESGITLWTGKRGEGKTTFLAGILLDAIDQGHKICAYSGELDAKMFKRWLFTQAAGPEWLDEYADRETGEPVYIVKEEAKQRINEWWYDKIMIVDDSEIRSNDEDYILQCFRYARDFCGCDVFSIDNMMTVSFSSREEFYRQQAEFASKVKQFAKATKSHVHIVAHPRKTQNGKQVDDCDEVGGSGDMTNFADSVVAVAAVEGNPDYDALLVVMKSRMKGKRMKVGVSFDPKSRRFYVPENGPYKRYGWDTREGGSSFTDITENNDEELPF